MNWEQVSTASGWPIKIITSDRSIVIDCNVPDFQFMDQQIWKRSLNNVMEELYRYRRLNLSGFEAIHVALNNTSEIIKKFNGISAISYVDPITNEIYCWPKTNSIEYADNSLITDQNFTDSLPFLKHGWGIVDIYYGNYGPVKNVQFSIKEVTLLEKRKNTDLWFILLEAYVSENGNDAILQKTAFVEVDNCMNYKAYEGNDILENAGGGGPYDWIMSDLVVTARGDIIANLPNHHDLGNVLLNLDKINYSLQPISTFKSPSPELAPIGREIDIETMKYLKRFPDHVNFLPGDRFEKMVAEILKSRGFSDIQMNVRNSFGEIDIIAFEAEKGSQKKGYIIECKRYSVNRKVSLREVHVLWAKKEHMIKSGIEKAMLITTSDFTKPARNLYNSALGLELKAHDELLAWLRDYKPEKYGYYI